MKKKRLLSLALAVTMLFGSAAMLPEGTFSFETSIKASAVTDGDWEYFENYDGTIDITKYNGFDSKLVIPSNMNGRIVVSIGNRAFAGNADLRSVVIPKGVMSIGWGAFEECKNLSSITIPDSVKSIQGDAFRSCFSLISIDIPKSVESIGIQAFYGCNLSNICVDDNNKHYCSIDGVLYSKTNNSLVFCPQLKMEIEIPNNVTSIDEWSFSGNNKLENITIPSSVENIGEHAFSNCRSLNSITIQGGVNEIKSYAFVGCEKLTRVIIEDGVKKIYSSAFSPCNNLRIQIPKSVIGISYSAFDINTRENNHFTIDLYKDSYAEQYAKDMNYNYEYLDIAKKRLAGSGRYATAAAISKGAYPKTAETVVLANGTKFADALAGATLAKAYDAPILLTEAGRLPDETLAEIKRLGAKNVIILGGSASVGQEVKDKLKENDLEVEIVKGKTKYATAVEIAKATKTVTKADPSEIFFVSADKFADALSVSAVAAKKNAPIIYLPKSGSLDADTAAYLKSVKGKIKNAYVIGGSGVIGADVMAAAGKSLGLTVDKNIVRVKGKTKYDTCVEVNTKFADVLNGTAICVATGEDFPDALAGGVFAAKNTAPLFLASGSLSENQKTYLKTKKAENIFVFGGSKSVPNELVQSIATASL